MCHRLMKVWVSCAVIAAVCGGTAPAWAVDRCTEPPSGLTAWWPGEGSVVNVIGGWHGALVGDTTFAAGEVGEAFSFDGSGDYVEVADADAAVLGSDPFTVAFWMNSTTTGSGVYLLGKSHPDGGQGWDIRLHLGQIMVVGFNGWEVNITSSVIIEADQWYHVAVASDGTTVTLFIDGATDPSWTVPRQSISATGNPLRFGWTTNYGGTAHSGELDEIQLFDRALSAAEIQVLRQSAPGGSCRPCAALPDGAVAWWRAENNFDDAIGRLNGAPVGGVAFDGGLVGRTFGLDGNDDYVALPRDAVWDFGTASISVTAWFQSGSAGYRNIIRYDTGTGVRSYWGLRFEPAGKLQFLACDTNGSTTAVIESDASYADGAWHHVTAVRDAAAGEVRLYVDGAEAATPTSDRGVNVVPPSNAVPAIGSGVWSFGGSFEPFAGSIDEVAIFDRALGADEAAAIFTAGGRGICHDCVAPPSGLVSWWRGDGNTFDQLGNWDGALVGDTGFAAGLVGQAFSFDGSGDWIQIDDSAAGDFGSEPFTVEFWVNTNGPGTSSYLVGRSHPDGGQGWDIRLNDSRIQIEGFNGWAAQYNLQTGQIIEVGSWHHIAVASDGVTVTLYVDGTTAPAWTIPRQSISTASNPLRFGSTTNYGGTGLDGLLDEIEFFDRALSHDEVLAVYRAGSFGRCTDCAPVPTGIEAWWRAEGDATDAAGSNDGTEMNGAGYGPGRVGRAFDLANDAAPDYVEVPHSASLDITGAISIESWVYMDELTAPAIVMKGDVNGSSSVTPYGLSISGWTYDGLVNGILYGSYPDDWFLSDDVVEVGAWHHLAFTWDGSTTIADNVNLYIDGRHAHTWSKTNPMVSSTESLTIGAMKPPTYHGTTDGRLDEVSIYSAELTAAEIRAIVAAGSEGKCVDGDSVPELFVFFDSIGHELSTLVGTDPVTVAGIDRPAAIGISACTAPLCWYAVNDGGWTAQAGVVENGDVVYVRQMTAASEATTTDLELTIGGVSDTFSTTTTGTFALTVTLAGIGDGAVTSSPAGIDCGATCAAAFDAGSTVTLTATPDAGSVFEAWSGYADCADGDVTMAGDVQCTATFGLAAIFADGFETGDTSEWSAATGGS